MNNDVFPPQNIKNKVIEIEDYQGNTIGVLEIGNNHIIKMIGFNIADIDEHDYIFNTDKPILRLQKIEK
jgi:hypothetical protein